jgi:hypothetical protein
MAAISSADWGWSGSSGSVSGSKAGVTSGSSGSAPSSLCPAGFVLVHRELVSWVESDGLDGFSSCGSTLRSVYLRGIRTARGVAGVPAERFGVKVV